MGSQDFLKARILYAQNAQEELEELDERKEQGLLALNALKSSWNAGSLREQFRFRLFMFILISFTVPCGYTLIRIASFTFKMVDVSRHRVTTAFKQNVLPQL